MLAISGYTVEHPLWEAPHRLAFRARAEASGNAVVIQIAREEFPSPEVIKGFQHEYELVSALDLPRVARIQKLGMLHQRPYLVFEDRSERPLRSLLASGPLPLARALRVARGAAAVLAELHGRDIMHRDLKPEHLLLSGPEDEVTLTGFSLASRDAWQSLAGGGDRVLEGTPAYLSPEQTGRLNRPVDYRTDLYSLGVTLYEMLTGRVPFEGSDTLELVHAHIAREPPSPDALVPGLPRVVRDIVLKLMAKSAEERYQSASALEADLRRCLQALESTGTIPPFPLAQSDVSSKLRFPQRLYGRDTERRLLTEAFERIADGGASELVLVLGYSGIGKSSITNEVRRPVVERGAHFVWGKYEQFGRNVPYSGIAQAFEDLVRQHLTRAPEQLAALRRELAQAVGASGRVLTDVIGALELLLGPQPEVPSLPSTEAENRFNLVFLRALRVLAAPSHPLVLFLDDLQWADSASLRLLEVIFAERELGHLLVIGAYRDNEVDAGHRLLDVVKSIESTGSTVRRIALSPLGAEFILQMVGDVVHRPTAEVVPLAELVQARTGGNPFFVKAFLTHLYESRALWFESREGRWRWELQAIAAMSGTANVVDLLAERLRRLEPEVLEAVKLGACIGNRFELSTLAAIQGVSPERPAALLSKAVEEGQVIQLSSGAPGEPLAYRFPHDRVQQAAYSLVAPEELPRLHLTIGRALLRGGPEQLFEVVSHLNKAIPILGSEAERRELAELNLKAARAAWAAYAFAAAGAFAATGLALLPAGRWRSDYALSKELHLLAARAAMKTGDAERTFEHSKEVLTRARTPEEKVEAYEVQIEYYTSVPELMHEAASTGIKALRLLGVDIPDKPTLLHVAKELAATRLRLRGRSMEDLAALPEMTDRTALAALRLIPKLTGSFYSVSPNAHVLVGMHALRLSLQYGNSPISPYTYEMYAQINAAALGNIDSGNAMARMAQALAERFNSRALLAQMKVEFYATTGHWKMPLRESARHLRQAADACLELGDHNFVGHGEGFYHWHLAFTGTPVDQLRDSLARMVERMQALRQPNYADISRYYHAWTLRLLGAEGTPGVEENIRAKLKKGGVNTNLLLCYLADAFRCFLLGDERGALAAAERVQHYKQFGPGTVAFAQHHFYYPLILLRQRDPSAWERQRALLQATLCLRKLRTWRRHCAVNFGHKVDLVEAELARVRGDAAAAVRLYERAIEGAHAGGFLHEAALASELAGEFHHQQGSTRAARAYLQDALYGYARWGAAAKVAQLQAAWPHSLLGTRAAADTEPPGGPSATSIPGSTGTTLAALDLGSVIKASSILSGEIELRQLLAKLMRIVLENAGARRGVLVINRGDELWIEAEGRVDEEVTYPRTPVDGDPRLSAAIIHYAARTGESVVLDDAAREGPFTFDPYITRHRTRSVLAAPLFNQGRLIALMYLENDLTVGAFTPGRLEVLKLLLAQAALSIHNASLYANVKATNWRLEESNRTLEQRVEERTRELHKAQQQLVVQEKLASLGSLTAGIAHELKNPLNFVTNFAELSVGLAQELAESLRAEQEKLAPRVRAEVDEVLGDLSRNVARIREHGLRANSIIQGMLLHARASSAGREAADFNAVLGESARLACNEFHAKEPGFEVRLDAEYDAAIGLVEMAAQDINRVFINLIGNACYALRQKARTAGAAFSPTITLRTKDLGERAEVRIRDNGTGIAQDVLSRLYEPFFTTKPAGEGAGLGLSISHDIIVLAHRGELLVDTAPGEFTEFIITLPKRAAPSASRR